jgi:hypothetical protein
MENNQNQQSFRLSMGKNPFIFLFLSLFILAGLIVIGNFAYPSVYGFIYKGAEINLKSDAELIFDLQTHQEEFNRIVRQIRQIETERQRLVLQRDRDNETIDQQLKKNAEINQKDESLKRAEMLRLGNEKNKNNKAFLDIIEAKRKDVDRDLQNLGYQRHLHFSREGRIVIPQKSFIYSESHFFSNLKTIFRVEEGYILFDENMQPDQRFVVDKIDKFHASGNIKTTIQKILREFGREENINRRYIYVHLEGNLYLYFCVSQVEHNPDQEI